MGGIRSSVRRRSHGDTGATLVEFALILPVFLMLLFGMITAGLALNEKQQMTHATREGARYAAAVPADQTFANGESWADNVQDLIVERSVGTLDDADAICVSLVEGSFDAAEPEDELAVVSPAGNHSTAPDDGPCIDDQKYPITEHDNGRRVQVTATKGATIELVLFGSYDVTMDIDATAKSESNS